MQRSSETIGTIAAALAKPRRSSSIRKIARWDNPVRSIQGIGTLLPLCAALEWARYRTQDLKSA